MYDVLIIGSGAAGMTAAIYTCRKNLKTGIISIDVGGQTNLTSEIENYPGVGKMPGWDLMKKFQEEAVGFGAEMIFGKAAKIDKKDDIFTVEMANGDKHQGKALILAFGKVPRSLGVPGEEKFMGRGVSTCVTCDAPFYKNKTVAVVGGGNSAVEGALELADIADKVYLIHRRDQFRADEITIKRLQDNPKIELILNSVLKEIKGDKVIDSVVIENKESSEQKELELDGVFIEIGYVVDTKMVEHLVDLNEKKEIIADVRGATSCPGIFAAGDVTGTPFKQTVISAGEGAKAGLEAHRYLTGGKGVSVDW